MKKCFRGGLGRDFPAMGRPQGSCCLRNRRLRVLARIFGQAYRGGSMGKRNERIALFFWTVEGGVGLQKVGWGGWLRLARKGDWRAGDGDLGMLIGFQESGRGYFRVGGNTIGT